MREYDPVAIAEDLAPPFDFRTPARFDDGTIHLYHGDRLKASDWELHPDTDGLLMVLSGRDPWKESAPPGGAVAETGAAARSDGVRRPSARRRRWRRGSSTPR